MLELLGDYTLRTVALGAAVLGLLSGALGTFAVLRRQSLLGDALAHATLPGVVLAFMLTQTRSAPVLMTGAALSAAAGALLLMTVVRRTRIKQDAALALVLSVFFGLGTVLLTVLAGTGAVGQSCLDRFLLGQAATLVAADVAAMVVLAALALAVVLVCFKELTVVSFDPGFARTLGYPVGRIELLMTALLVLAIVVGIQTVGVVLMAALLITPAAAARQWTDRLAVMVVLAGVIGAVSGVTGAVVSATTANLPTGPLIVLVATAIFLVSLPTGHLRRRLLAREGSGFRRHMDGGGGGVREAGSRRDRDRGGDRGGVGGGGGGWR